MATTGRGLKTTFLRDLFRENPNVNYKEANEAWKAAGHEEDLSSNTFYNTKREFKKQDGSGTTASAKVGPKPKAKDQPAKAAQPKRTTKPSSAPENGRDLSPERQVSQEATRTGDRDRVFDEVESGIDDLIFLLKMVGGEPEVEAKLREVRRSLHPSQR